MSYKPVARRRNTFRVTVVGDPKLPIAHVARAMEGLGLVIGPDGFLGKRIDTVGGRREMAVVEDNLSVNHGE